VSWCEFTKNFLATQWGKPFETVKAVEALVALKAIICGPAKPARPQTSRPQDCKTCKTLLRFCYGVQSLHDRKTVLKTIRNIYICYKSRII